MQTRRTIRTGIIGQGRSGRGIHGMLLSQMPELYEIVAVSDPFEPYRAAAVNDFGCEAYVDYKEMLERDDLDLIVNASPSHLHVPLSIEIMEKGFHVLCEKPLARSSEEVDELIEVSRKTSRFITVFQQSRFTPVFEKIRSVIDSGVFGRIVMIRVAMNGFARRWDWQTLQENYGGNLLNTGPHPLDQLLHLFGDENPNVVCRMDRVNTYGDAEDFVKLLMYKEDQPVIDLEISSCDAYKGPVYHIDAQYGGLTAEGKSVKWRYFKPDEAPKQELIRLPLQKEDGSPAYCNEELKFYEESWKPSEDQLNVLQYAGRKLYRQLYRALTEEGQPLPVTAQQVRRQIAVVEECHRQNPLSSIEN